MDIQSNNQVKIAPVLKNLDIFKTAEFPLTKTSVVSSTIQRLKTESGKNFTQKKNNQVLEVTRIK